MSFSLRILTSIMLIASALLVSACAPKVGSPEWCKAVEEKPKGDLTMNEAKEYAKHCIFK
ncbi:MAG TPA: DUF3012 domain-containing protein [Cellvibrio sp.]|nr:DUF3012 domain-containing protein [Cellvibrio sp.]